MVRYFEILQKFRIFFFDGNIRNFFLIVMTGIVLCLILKIYCLYLVFALLISF